MAIIMDYVFASKHVANPDSTFPTDIPTDSDIVDGPGAFQVWNFPKLFE